MALAHGYPWLLSEKTLLVQSLEQMQLFDNYLQRETQERCSNSEKVVVAIEKLRRDGLPSQMRSSRSKRV